MPTIQPIDAPAEIPEQKSLRYNVEEEESDGNSEDEAPKDFKDIPKIISGRENENLAKDAAMHLQVIGNFKLLPGEYCHC